MRRLFAKEFALITLDGNNVSMEIAGRKRLPKMNSIEERVTGDFVC